MSPDQLTQVMEGLRARATALAADVTVLREKVMEVAGPGGEQEEGGGCRVYGLGCRRGDGGARGVGVMEVTGPGG